MAFQTCITCKIEKEMTEENFYRKSSAKSGYESKCKSCRRISDKAKYERKKEKISLQKKRYYERKKETIKKRQREYYRRNTDKCKLSSKKWDKENPVQRRIINEQSRTKRHGCDSDLTEQEWIDTKVYFDNSCAYCGMTEKEHLELMHEQLHHEHVVSLESGGSYSKRNIVPACRMCNCSKAGHDFEIWYRSFKFYNPVREDRILRHIGGVT
ncbi:HNH endonuclease [Streptococcus sp. S784/96/1]|uniref:HNH endonuclease n=1 Tax=Streptococcus sp. S784/96/1 TaxID=2653499 RepID=UPI00138A5773|nr:HNH endonuclease [Streptococcus sp. S784/96/1]